MVHLTDLAKAELKEELARAVEKQRLAQLELTKRALDVHVLTRVLEAAGEVVEAEVTGVVINAQPHGVSVSTPVNTPTDDAFDRMLVRHIKNRNSGFKPSELKALLVKVGHADDGTLSDRVTVALQTLEREGALQRTKTTKRYTVTEKADELELPY